MIVPAEGVDDLGQPIQANCTLLQYTLRLAYRGDRLAHLPLEIKQESLRTIGSEEADKRLLFRHDVAWWKSAVLFDGTSGRNLIVVPGPARLSSNGHWITPPDRSDTLIPALLPRTLLSSATAHPDAAAVTLAQQEMRAWRVLHLDPAALRQTSYLSDRPILVDSGYGFVRALHAIANIPPNDGRDPYEAETAVYARVAGAIWDLLGEVLEIGVEPVNERGELELTVTQRDGTKHSLRALSDGTLRFLVLAVLVETEESALYCFEEPENGVHPGRIESLLKLLEAIAMDTRYPIEEGNPLRQVIISTHSPSVVMRVPADSLVVAELRDTVRNGKHFNRAYFSGLANTWRDPVPSRKSLALGRLLTYLNPEGYRPLPRPDPDRDPDADQRIMDRPDVRDLLTPLPKLDG